MKSKKHVEVALLLYLSQQMRIGTTIYKIAVKISEENAISIGLIFKDNGIIFINSEFKKSKFKSFLPRQYQRHRIDDIEYLDDFIA